jgi:hypothetical protein
LNNRQQVTAVSPNRGFQVLRDFSSRKIIILAERTQLAFFRNWAKRRNVGSNFRSQLQKIQITKTEIIMKKLSSLILIFIFGTLSYSQSAKEMLAEIDGKWQLDDNQNVTILKIVEVPELKKEEIFSRALNYFTYNYVSGKSVIQTQDKENGLIVGKGVYDNVHVGMSIFATYVDAWHVLRVDVKDGRARLIISLTEYEKETMDGNVQVSYSTVKVSQEYPINPKGGQKTIMTKAFYKAFKKANASLDALEKAIREGNTSKAIENSGW